MRSNDFSIYQLVQDLEGSCNTIESQLPDGMSQEDLTQEDLNDLENEIFLCDECGWWSEISEMTEDDDDNQICRDCKGE